MPDRLRSPPRPLLPVGSTRLRLRATLWLVAATVLWGLSFPLAKALAIAQHALLPGADTWFLAAVSLVVRFGLAAWLLALGSLRTWRTMTRRNGGRGWAWGCSRPAGCFCNWTV